MDDNQWWLTMPPFPRLAWDGDSWTGADRLPAWSGFQSRGGPYGSRDNRRPSRGEVRISVHVATAGDGTPALPDAAQRRAYAYLKANDARIAAVIHRRVLRRYPEERRWALLETDNRLADRLPPVKDVAGLRKVVGLNTVHLLPVSWKDHAYVGFECGCEWEEEHGYGVMTHRARILEDGHAETAFNESPAARDRAQRGARPSR
jgi:hypothetical protein